jgi:nitroimidazol reductase NimA-like FMN-containing flavoprotein (pyridoxamine 5'-phosphate oxidase superfamily)
MPYTFRELTDNQKEEFLTDNVWGILSFNGDMPYAIPVGYRYRKGTFIFGLDAKGRKMDFINRNRSVCLVVCRPASLSIIRKEYHPVKTVIIEGELEDMTDTDLAYYGLPIPSKAKDYGYDVVLFKLSPNRVGTQELGISDPDLW